MEEIYMSETLNFDKINNNSSDIDLIGLVALPGEGGEGGACGFICTQSIRHNICIAPTL